MVWGIERSIPLATGRGKPGNEARHELFSRLESILDSEIEGGSADMTPEIPESSATIRYRYQLMQGAPEKIKPRTVLLRQGLNVHPAPGAAAAR